MMRRGIKKRSKRIHSAELRRLDNINRNLDRIANALERLPNAIISGNNDNIEVFEGGISLNDRAELALKDIDNEGIKVLDSDEVQIQNDNGNSAQQAQSGGNVSQLDNIPGIALTGDNAPGSKIMIQQNSGGENQQGERNQQEERDIGEISGNSTASIGDYSQISKDNDHIEMEKGIGKNGGMVDMEIS